MASQQPKENKKVNKKRSRVNSEQLQQFDSLNWNSSLQPNDDSFSLLVGSNELEGGFLSLEEIDEAEYALEIPIPDKDSEVQVSKGKTKSKKQKRTKIEDNSQDDGDEDSGDVIEAEVVVKKKKNQKKKKGNKDEKIEDNSQDDGDEVSGEAIEDEVKEERKRVKKKKIQKKKKGNIDAKDKSEEVEDKENPEDVDALAEPAKDDTEEELIDEAEYYEWNNLRLHPLLMRSIYRLKFKEPTPIQKACIPAAAHQGKDVIGAAETGSGKTLAFGLPILQRLLEEREKAESSLIGNGEADEKLSQGGFLRALIITPTRELALQITDHLKQAAKGINIKVVPIVGGMSTEKQERLLKSRPEIVVGTPGRLWELMSGGEIHFVELHSLSFFVLDEADRMIESGHFRELQSIIDMLPVTSGSIKGQSLDNQNCVTVSNLQRKKRQTFVFSATIALSADFRKKLKRGSMKSKSSNELNSIEALSERAGMRENAAIVDLTNASILANKLEESFIECREEDKDAYLYYILSAHGQGRTIVFCTSIAALRHLSSILRILGIDVFTLHAQMQQRARLKAMDRFRANEHAILVATDVAARGLDIPGVRTVIHYQLPHSAEVYVHRSGRTARAFSDGCCIALISPNETSKFAELCRTFEKESFRRFPIELSYMPEVMKRISMARQIDKITRKDSQDKAKKTWFEKNADIIGLDLEENDSEEERVKKIKQKKTTSSQLSKLQQELRTSLSRPLQPKSLSSRFVAGAGISPQLQHQFEELARQKLANSNGANENKRRKLLVIGQDSVEPLQALRSAGQEGHTDLKEISVKRRNVQDLKRKRKQEKTRVREQRRKQKKNAARG